MAVTVRELLEQDVDPVQNGAHCSGAIRTVAPVAFWTEKARLPIVIPADDEATLRFAHALETVVPVREELTTVPPRAKGGPPHGLHAPTPCDLELRYANAPRSATAATKTAVKA